MKKATLSRYICEFLEDDATVAFNSTWNDVLSKLQGLYSELDQAVASSGFIRNISIPFNSREDNKLKALWDACQLIAEKIDMFVAYKGNPRVGSKMEFLLKALEEYMVLLKKTSEELKLIKSERRQNKSTLLKLFYKSDLLPGIMNTQRFLELSRKSTFVL